MAKKLSTLARIRKYIKQNPNATTSQIIQAINVTAKEVYSVRYLDKKKIKKTQKSFSPMNTLSIQPIEMIEPKADPVNHPPHYKTGGVETIDFIEAKQLNYNLGNVIKYVARADHKGNRKQDLEKALWYLKREIAAQ